MLGRVHEIYLSLSGEGMSIGIPTIFIRFAGCSLRCGKMSGKALWCDTPYALGPKEGLILAVEDVIQRVENLDPKSVCQILFTGGEPLEGKNGQLLRELSQLIFAKRKAHSSLYPMPRIETNGKESIDRLEHCVVTLDYKLPGSGMEAHMRLENFRILEKRHNILDEMKFVVRDREDYERSLQVLNSIPSHLTVLYSPVYGELPPTDLAEWIKDSKLPNVRFSYPLHKVLWGDKKGI